MQEYQGYIYCITNNINSKIYIGQTRNSIEDRFARHIQCARNGKRTTILLYLAMRKYGIENFSIDTIESVRANSREQLQKMLNEREIFYIEKMNSFKPTGYNMTCGGDRPPEQEPIPVFKVEETGLIVSKYNSIADASKSCNISSRSIRHGLSSLSHYSNGYYWYMQSDLPNMSVGDLIPPQARQDIVPVYCFDMNGEFIKRYDSISEAKNDMGICQGKISDVCSGKRLSTGGYLWSYTPTPPEYNPRNHTCRCRPVLQLTMDGMPLREYYSASEAARDLELQSSLITACCNGRRKSTGGYRWTFSM